MAEGSLLSCSDKTRCAKPKVSNASLFSFRFTSGCVGLKSGNQHCCNKSQHKDLLAIKSECDLFSLPSWVKALSPTETRDIMAACFCQHPKPLASRSFPISGLPDLRCWDPEQMASLPCASVSLYSKKKSY